MIFQGFIVIGLSFVIFHYSTKFLINNKNGTIRFIRLIVCFLQFSAFQRIYTLVQSLKMKILILMFPKISIVKLKIEAKELHH
jgi:hypothetical protein